MQSATRGHRKRHCPLSAVIPVESYRRHHERTGVPELRDVRELGVLYAHSAISHRADERVRLR
jgi:hypothetical protein